MSSYSRRVDFDVPRVDLAATDAAGNPLADQAGLKTNGVAVGADAPTWFTAAGAVVPGWSRELDWDPSAVTVRDAAGDVLGGGSYPLPDAGDERFRVTLADGADPARTTGLTLRVSKQSATFADKANLIPVRLGLTAHRTGDLAGQAVSQTAQQSGDPTQYVVLTDNTTSFDPAAVTPNFALPTAAIGGGDYVRGQTGGPVDPDLAKITLKQIPASADAGLLTIALLDSGNNPDVGGVRLFKDDGTLLYDAGTTGPGPLTLDLANPSGYLAGLKTGDLNVWLQGVRPDPNFTLAAVYTDPSGQRLPRTDVHMDLAQWDFVGTDGQPVGWTPSVAANTLLAALGSGDNGTAIDDNAKFRVRIQDLPSAVVQQMTIASDDTADSYNAAVADDPSQAVMSRPAVMYHTDEEETITPADAGAIRSQMALDVVHNQGAVATTRTANDQDSRHLTAITAEIDPQARIFDYGKKTYVDASAADIGPFAPINAIPNPSAIVIQPESTADTSNCAHIVVSRIQGLAGHVMPNDARLQWSIDSVNLGGAAFLHQQGVGNEVYVYGTTAGYVNINLSVEGPDHVFKKMVTYLALVVPRRIIPYRIQLMKDFNGAGTKVSPEQADQQIIVANQILRQVGVELVPDTTVKDRNGDGLPTPFRGVYTLTAQTYQVVDVIASDNDASPDSAAEQEDIRFNATAKVLNIVYVGNLIDDASQAGNNVESYAGATVNAAGNTQQSVSLAYQLAVGQPVANYTLKLQGGHPAGFGPQNWGVLIGDSQGDPAQFGDAYASTLAHEVGHEIGYKHRAVGSDSIPNTLPNAAVGFNLMESLATLSPKPPPPPSAFIKRVDLDLIQALAVETSKLFS